MSKIYFVFLAALVAFLMPAEAQQGASDPAHINGVPYISLYYVEPKVPAGQEAVIKYYVTDSEQKDYFKDDNSLAFTMEYWVNGVKGTLRDVKAGDNSLSLKNLSPGKVLFALQATDNTGRKSHRLFQEFLVVSPANELISPNKTLTPDLKKFGISNDDTHAVETTKGLTEMLKWASENGYRKVVLPKGRYRIDENSSVMMATRLVLDMNGSTFKLNPNALAKSMMFRIVDCFDSHVINGTFEGDLKEHDFEKAPNHSEWVCAVEMGKGAEYCSFANIKIIDVTGYGSNTTIVGTDGHYSTAPKNVSDFVPGDINEKGETVPSQIRSSSEKMIDISDFKAAHGFFQLGTYLGYQGNAAGHWIYKASFYDENQKFIENIEGYLYRRLYFPQNAKFARFTLYSTAKPTLSLFDFRPPYNCSFINVHHENIRAVGMCPSGFNNLLVEGNTFENCGWELARCAFDAEDGWDLMQDLTFRNNTFGKNPANEFLTTAGHNIVAENNTMSVYMWDRTNSTVFRNNKIKTAHFLVGSSQRSGFHRISQNTFENGAMVGNVTEKPDRAYMIRDNVINGNATSELESLKPNATYFYKCRIDNGAFVGRGVECVLKNINNVGGVYEITKSKVEDSNLKTSVGASRVTESTLKNSTIEGVGGPTVVLEKNTIIDSVFFTNEDWSPAHSWTFTDNKIETSRDRLMYIANSYKQVTLKGNTIQSSNPQFSAVYLHNPTNANLKEIAINVEGNSFQGHGGSVINVSQLPVATCTLTVNFLNNKGEGLTESAQNLLNLPNVRINQK